MPKMDYSRLLGRIKEKGLTQKSVANAIGMTESHFSRKISGEFPFTQAQITSLCEALDIFASDIGDYFFTPDVEKTKH